MDINLKAGNKVFQPSYKRKKEKVMKRKRD